MQSSLTGSPRIGTDGVDLGVQLKETLKFTRTTSRFHEPDCRIDAE